MWAQSDSFFHQLFVWRQFCHQFICVSINCCSAWKLKITALAPMSLLYYDIYPWQMIANFKNAALFLLISFKISINLTDKFDQIC